MVYFHNCRTFKDTDIYYRVLIKFSVSAKTPERIIQKAQKLWYRMNMNYSRRSSGPLVGFNGSYFSSSGGGGGAGGRGGLIPRESPQSAP